MVRNLMWRAAAIALVALPFSGVALPAWANGAPSAESQIGTVPMVLLVTSALWIVGMTVFLAFRRRRTHDADER